MCDIHGNTLGHTLHIIFFLFLDERMISTIDLCYFLLCIRIKFSLLLHFCGLIAPCKLGICIREIRATIGRLNITHLSTSKGDYALSAYSGIHFLRNNIFIDIFFFIGKISILFWSLSVFFLIQQLIVTFVIIYKLLRNLKPVLKIK